MSLNTKDLKEITVRGIVLGALITLVFTASNVYLGLKVGLTFSSSIPAAVISMAVLSLFSRSSILENNMVQTQASAAGTLSATIFVLPALLMVGYWQSFPFWQTMMICGAGGMLGVVFSIPLRRTMIVNSDLPYPEGVAAAEILKVAHDNEEKNESGAKSILWGGAVASAVTFITGGFQLLASGASYWFRSDKVIFQFPMSFSLALMSAGYLMGLMAGVAMLIGAILAWFGFVPYLMFTSDIQQTVSTDQLISMANALWKDQVRFIGAGTLAIASVWTLLTLFKPMIHGVKLSFQALRDKTITQERTDRDLSAGALIAVLLVSLVVLVISFYSFVDDAPVSNLYAWGLVLFSVVAIFIIGFFIAAACGYMAGLIGSSNSPISGIGIVAVIVVSVLLLLLTEQLISTDEGKKFAMALAIFITSGVVAVAAIANDNLQDLKTGYLVGATPRSQQIALLIGCVVGAIVIAPILDVLYQAYGLAGAVLPREGMDTTSMLSAPQATLMKTIATGIFSHQLDWTMFVIGLIVGAIFIVIDGVLSYSSKTLRISALAVGLGIYLPVDITMAIVVGSLLSWIISCRVKSKKLAKDEETKMLADTNRRGVLIASGFIVGESLVGVLLAIVILISLSLGLSDTPFSLDRYLVPMFGSALPVLKNSLGLLVFIVVCAVFYKKTFDKK